MKQLILGGARSGKSRLAEQRAKATNNALVYIATGQAKDQEMQERIAFHQQARGTEWTLVEEPQQLAQALKSADKEDTTILIDCLTLWLSNCLASGSFDSEKKLFIEQVANTRCNLFIVSNEVGSGVVPLGELSREFVDQSGWLHQALATLCDNVTLVVAGLPLELK